MVTLLTTGRRHSALELRQISLSLLLIYYIKDWPFRRNSRPSFVFVDGQLGNYNEVYEENLEGLFVLF